MDLGLTQLIEHSLNRSLLGGVACSWVGGVLGAADYGPFIVIKKSSFNKLQSPPSLASILETKTVTTYNRLFS